MYINKQKNSQRDLLMNDLANNVAVVVFRKKNGNLRAMTCTRCGNLIPEEMVTTNLAPKHLSDDVIPVFDLDKQAWRSFRINSIEYYSHKR